MTDETEGYNLTAENYRCQFCCEWSPADEWKEDKCPRCGAKYSWLLAQDSEE